MLTYQSTRGADRGLPASRAIINGIAGDNGLYVPSFFPQLPKPMGVYADYTYQDLAKEILSLYLTDFSQEEISQCVDRAYGDQFDCPAIAPVVKAGKYYFLELFHGPTYAFKDMALQILPSLMRLAASKQGIKEDILILTATSGDTGKAAMEGFVDVAGTKIMVFYPKNGVSFIQEYQMCSQRGDNVGVVGLDGNFDHAQTGVKGLFQDREFVEDLRQKGYLLSSANSINIGRLLPQVVYYVYAYSQLLKTGDLSPNQKLDVVVPTGNFGNILAAYYARKMGLPLGHLVAASNQNKVIADFLTTGNYDKNREMYLSQSPSMDILVSSNLERLLYDITGSRQVGAYMDSLNRQGQYEISQTEKANLVGLHGLWADTEECNQVIRQFFRQENYLMDTHTAVAVAVAEKTDLLSGQTLVVSTASPYKFSAAVLAALDRAPISKSEDFSGIEKLRAKSQKPIPDGIADLPQKEIRFRQVIAKQEMKQAVLDFLAGQA